MRNGQSIVAVCALVLTVILARQLSADTEQFVGLCTEIVDGDTLKITRGEDTVVVNLDGIRCPELKQPFGEAAKLFTSTMCLGARIAVRVTRSGDSGEIYGDVVLPDGTILNQKLVRFGLAWWDKVSAPENETLEHLETDARALRRGLWKDDSPVPPWMFHEPDTQVLHLGPLPKSQTHKSSKKKPASSQKHRPSLNRNVLSKPLPKQNVQGKPAPSRRVSSKPSPNRHISRKPAPNRRVSSRQRRPQPKRKLRPGVRVSKSKSRLTVAPGLSPDAKAPHEYRGACVLCHTIREK
ncbi:MAG: thermonuclease family protein [Candidatus Hydrogenedentes bacterium]|nr:thermonuclease family protein [Candidatus Hydrogenedentota bacterium]